MVVPASIPSGAAPAAMPFPSVELIAHDLRNYFANIIFAADLLCNSDSASPRQHQLADSIRNSADSGILFLQAFLDQQEHQARGARIEPLPVRQLLCEVVDLFSRSAEAKEIKLELIGHETVIVSGLRGGVMHVLQNLVSNAVKYSPHHTIVSITASKHGNSGWMQVMDRGPGISDEDQASPGDGWQPVVRTPRRRRLNLHPRTPPDPLNCRSGFSREAPPPSRRSG